METKILKLTTLLLLPVILAGCAGQDPGQVAEQLALGTQTAKSFLNEYPNADVVAAYISEEDSNTIISDIRSKCGDQIKPKNYWKVSIIDPSTDLNLIVWIDATKQEAVCAIKTGAEYVVSQPEPKKSEVEPPPEALPDLTLSNSDIIFSTESPTAGEAISIAVTIHNTGTATAPLVLYNVYDGDELIGYTNAPTSLDSGASVTYNFKWEASPGTHTFRISADPSDQVPESYEDNNVIEVVMVVSQPIVTTTSSTSQPTTTSTIPTNLPDLMLKASDISYSPSRPMAGNSVTVNATIRNIGNVESPGFIYNIRDITLNRTIGFNNVPLKLAANSSTTVSHMWWQNVTVGTHSISVSVDPSNTVVELDENNNIGQVDIVVG